MEINNKQVKQQRLYLLNISVLVLFTLLGFKFREETKITVYLAGDSTMAVKLVSKYPETGWGMPFANFFDQSVIVDNRAKNGRSTKTFIAENLWQPIKDNLKQGDYVLIQFGHNDEVPTKRSATTEEEFRNNLVRFVNETYDKKANPVLITPVARRTFDENGKMTDSHKVYAEIVRNVAKDLEVPLIDLDKESTKLLQDMGPENSKLLFNKLEPGQNPNYPKGVDDNTHFNEYGARRIAEIVLLDIRKLKLGLADRIVKP